MSGQIAKVFITVVLLIISKIVRINVILRLCDAFQSMNYLHGKYTKVIQGRLPFDQKFRNFRNGDKWYENFLRKVPENPEIVEFPKSEPFNRKFPKFRDENQMERKFPRKNFRKFGSTSRGCPLFRNSCKFAIFYSALATSFGRDQIEDDSDAYSIKKKKNKTKNT